MSKEKRRGGIMIHRKVLISLLGRWEPWKTVKRPEFALVLRIKSDFCYNVWNIRKSEEKLVNKMRGLDDSDCWLKGSAMGSKFEGESNRNGKRSQI